MREIRSRLEFLQAVGLRYLTLSRSAATLSGGESQRIRLATQIGSSLMGVLYILDEPSIGLHQRDNDKLLDTLRRLRDLPRERRRCGRHIRQNRVRRGGLQNAAGAEIHLPHVVREADDGDDRVAACGAFADAAADGRAVRPQPLGLFARAVVHKHLMSGLEQIARHRRAHDAGADESDFHIFKPLPSMREFSPF